MCWGRAADITVTLTFVRSMEQESAVDPCDESIKTGSTKSRVGSSLMTPWPYFQNQFAEIEHIDTHAPLSLRSRMSRDKQKIRVVYEDWPPRTFTEKRLLLLDLLAIHMVRDVNGSTIISYHHAMDGSTTAKDLFTRLKLVGRSVYWWDLNPKVLCVCRYSTPVSYFHPGR